MARPRSWTAVALVLAVMSAACGWPADRFDAARTGHNPLERQISSANVASLQPEWTGDLGPGVSARSSPLAAGGFAYVGGSPGGFFAFADDGTTNCAGTPAVCQPAWTAPTATPVTGAAVTASGTAFVGTEGGTLYAFSATGTTNCSGMPTVCTPMWTASLPVSVRPPIAVGGVVYVVADMLYAFDAAGTVDCNGTPTVCQPLWTGAIDPMDSRTQPPAVAGGIVYVASAQGGGSSPLHLYAFDAAGTTGCSGAPKVCAPLWSAHPGCAALFVCTISAPAVAGGRVFVGSNHSDEFPHAGVLYAYDADGHENCSGSPVICAPLWVAGTDAQFEDPAVANGVVYVSDFSNFDFVFPEGRLRAFDAAGITNCSGGVCSPLWWSEIFPSFPGGPTVANGLAYVTNGAGRILAFDAAGNLGCSGAPSTCSPLWSADPIGAVSPTPANGQVYTRAGGDLVVFGLP